MRSENRSLLSSPLLSSPLLSSPLLSSPLLLSLIALFVALSERAVAQVPNPQRHVHPSIADPAPAAVLHGPGPMLQYPDGKWNHGEGFAAVGSPDVDSGGWHFGDDGTNVTSADIHLTGTQTWAGHTVHFQTSPWGVAHVQRLQGYLRPATIALPLTHPRYGSLGLTAPDGFVDSGAAQTTWRVSWGDPTAHYTDLPAAVAAAAPGDLILVYDHPSQTLGYDYTAVTIDKPLSIVGLYPGSGPGPNPTFAVFKGLFRIRGIPAGQRVVISNAALTPIMPPYNFIPAAPYGIIATDCDGDIVLEDIWFQTGGVVNARFRFERCRNVVLRGCELYQGGEPVTAIDSNLLVTTTRIWQLGYMVYPPPFVEFSTTTEALRIRNSSVTLVNSWVWGADRITYNSYSPARWAPRPGAVIESGELIIGPFTILTGGSDSTGPREAFVRQTPGVGYVVRDPRTTLLGNLPGAGYATQNKWQHSTFHSWIVAGEPYQVVVAGPSGGFALLGVGSALTTPLHTGFGLLAIDPASLQLIGASSLASPNGDHQWTFVCPTNVPNGYVSAFQAAVLDPVDGFSLTLPSPFTVGWQHGRMP